MRHVCWAVLVLSACEVHLDDFGRRYATAMCEREVRCGAREPVDCNRQITVPEIEEKILDTRLGVRRYQPAEAARCVELINEAPCTAQPEITARCHGVFVGALSEGETCRHLEASWSDVGCAPGLFCMKSETLGCGTCSRLDERGACDTANGFGPPSGAPCQKLPEAGEACLVASDVKWCSIGYACNQNGTCEWPEMKAPSCVHVPRADGGIGCVEVVQPLGLLPEGAGCDADMQCALHRCDEGRCRAERFQCE